MRTANYATLLLLLALATVSLAADDCDAEGKDIITENGYLVEEHKVTTKDGYILTVFRIPGKKGAASGDRPPVFFQHGILDSSDCWLMNYASKAPAFLASDAGFDVWLGNSRGNKYSRAHKTLDPDSDDSFWFFDWQDMGNGDVPAAIDYVLATTGYAKVAYIGHSQGTTQMFWALSNDQAYFNEKVSLFIALGPVAAMSDVSSLLLDFLAYNVDLVTSVTDTLGIYEFFPSGYLTTGPFRVVCGTIPALCQFGASFIADEDPEVDDTDRFGVYMCHFPNGASRRSLVHYAQEINAADFQQYDYGAAADKKIYGQPKPPMIDLTKIKNFPIALMHGTSDKLADPTDVKWMEAQLKVHKNVVFSYDYNMGHLTFMVGKEMSYFAVDAIQLLKQYQGKTPKLSLLEA